ncbi:glycosyltransferase family 1 protein [Paenibacillus sp. 453mf]|uniref:glycosyltransferase family 4 protein n=1 Tax=Paenibacillus sp. 453mf TaxID=1761874 RepID=UPI0008E1177B|nr:glycosyltransferase family 1 protein [Paenibacillus sp. 453mf]SFS38881.1 Glycosyltransferase involved in cell wall bisynthesis [Paenibacillus sp. 453mf]
MRIGVDVHVLAGKFQGSRTYLLNLYNEVLKHGQEEKFYFFGHWSSDYPYGSNVNYVNFKSLSKIKRLTYETSPLLKNNKIDLYHTTYISPIITPCETVVTIHDVLFETHPQYFTKKEVIRNKILVKNSAIRAKQIHTVSQYSKDKIIELYNVPEDKVKIVPNGVDISKFSADNKLISKEIVLKEFGVENYILTVGRIEPRKNHVALLKAYKILKDKNKNKGKLVIVGKPDFGFKEFFNYIELNGLKEDVVILNSVDDNNLPHLYKAAEMFIYPTFAEGFGIPPIEAMASGVPVISSNLTAIPEVIGDAGILINPNNEHDIYEQIVRISEDSGLQNDLIRRGLNQSKLWSWQNSASAYKNALDEIS